jgi:GMP synthase (glutamine-hydrolysing)
MVNSEQKHKTETCITILQHIHCETPGIISQCLQSADVKMRWIRTFEGDPIPSNMEAQAGLLIMGGPMSVYDHAQFPFLIDEQRLIEQALKDDKPVLGVCLGSQLLAATLGAEVKSGDRKEIGWHPITLTEPASTDFLWKGLPQQLKAYHWHGDVFDLPRGAVSLASSELTACQGFRFGENAYGFLFHMEVTEKIIKNMVSEFEDELNAEAIAAESIIQNTKENLPELQAVGDKVFGRWVKLLKPD